MKVLISSSGPEISSPVDPRFGRAPYYIIVDTENPDNFRSIPNPQAQAASGAGIAAAQMVVQEGVQAVISGAFGPNAQAVLQSAGIRMFTAPSGITVAQALEMLENGTLPEASGSPSPGYGPGYGPGFGGPGFGGPGYGPGFGPGGGWGRGWGRGRGGRGKGGWGRGGGRGRGGGWGW